MASADWRSTEAPQAPYRFTAMNTLKGQRIRSAANRGNTVTLENWFNLPKVMQIYNGEPVPLHLLDPGQIYLLESPPGLPMRLVLLDRKVGNRVDLFDVTKQETITVDLGADYQLHKYFPDQVIAALIRQEPTITSGVTRTSNYASTTYTNPENFESTNFATNENNFASVKSAGGRRMKKYTRRIRRTRRVQRGRGIGFSQPKKLRIINAYIGANEDRVEKARERYYKKQDLQTKKIKFNSEWLWAKVRRQPLPEIPENLRGLVGNIPWTEKEAELKKRYDEIDGLTHDQIFTI